MNANNIYVGMRYVPIFQDWNINNAYEALVMVTVNNTTYISKKPVPAATLIDNTDYWAPMYVQSEAITQLQTQLAALQSKVNTINPGSWISASKYNILPDGNDISQLLTNLPSNLEGIAFESGQYTVPLDFTWNAHCAVYFSPDTTFSNPITIENATQVFNPNGSVTLKAPTFVYNPISCAIDDPAVVMGGSALVTVNDYGCMLLGGAGYYIKQLSVSSPTYIFGSHVSISQLATSATLVLYGGTVQTDVVLTGTLECHNVDDIHIPVSKAYECSFAAGRATYAENCNLTNATAQIAEHCTGSPASITFEARNCDFTNMELDNLPLEATNCRFSLSDGGTLEPTTTIWEWNNVTLSIQPSGANKTITISTNSMGSNNRAFFTRVKKDGTITLTGIGPKPASCISCDFESIPSSWFAIDTPLGTPLPSGGTTSQTNTYSIGYGFLPSGQSNLTDIPNVITSPGAFTGGTVGYPFGIRIFKNGQPITEDSGVSFVITTYMLYDESLHQNLNYFGTVSSDATLGTFRFPMGSIYTKGRGEILYICFKDEISGEQIWFNIIVPAVEGLNTKITTPLATPLLFTNALYFTSNNVQPSPLLTIYANVTDGQKFRAWDRTGTPIEIQNITFRTGLTSVLAANVTYDMSKSIHSIAQWPEPSTTPIGARVTFTYNTDLDTRVFNCQYIPVLILPS